MAAISRTFPATRRLGVSGWLNVALLSGVAAAAAATVFNLAVSERVLDEAARRERPAHDVMLVEPFTRVQQHGGMIVGELLLGLTAALLFAGAALVIGPRAGAPRRVWLGLTGAAVFAIVLLPAIKYPPRPPGVESDLPIGERQTAYLLLVAVGLAGAGACVALFRRGARSPAAVALLLPAALAFALLPADHGETALPSRLVNEFRVTSIAAQLIFWLAFGLLGSWLLRRRDA
jgi:predicted cobalt transporter CbtA